MDWSKGREAQAAVAAHVDYTQINRLEEAKDKAELELSIGCDLPDAPAHWSDFDRKMFYNDVAGAARTYYVHGFKTPEEAVAAHAKFLVERDRTAQQTTRANMTSNITAMFGSKTAEESNERSDRDTTSR